MGKTWIKPASIVGSVCLGVVVLARVLLGLVVGSAEFRDLTARALEQALGQVLPGVMVEFDSVELSGLYQIDMANLLVRSGQKVDVTVIAPTLHISPRLGPLLARGLLVVDLDVTLPEGGRLESQIAAPLRWIVAPKSRQGERFEPYLALEGRFEGLSIPPLFALWMAGENRPAIQLTAGRVTGRFAIRKPVGATRVTGRKSGRVDLQILSPRWIVAASEEAREVKPANMDVSLELQDFVLSLRQPLVFQDTTERAVVTGALLLPKYADEDLAWDLIVQSQGSGHPQQGLARLLRCKNPPEKPTFAVKGHLGAPRCEG